MLGGLGGRLAWESMQPRRRRCERCGLYYRETLEKCRWCGDLDDAGLAQLKLLVERQHQANRSLGRLFLVLTLVTALLLFLI